MLQALSLADGCLKDEKLREEIRRLWPGLAPRVMQLLQEVEADKEKVRRRRGRMINVCCGGG